MDPFTVAATTIHLVFAALWVGSVGFVTIAVVPIARDGDLNATPLSTIADRLIIVSRASAALLLLSGGHMAGTLYTVESLTGTTRGYFVIGMVVLWLTMMGLVEAATGRLTSGLQTRKVREPAKASLPLYRGAAVVGVLLFIDAGFLTTGLV